MEGLSEDFSVDGAQDKQFAAAYKNRDSQQLKDILASSYNEEEKAAVRELLENKENLEQRAQLKMHDQARDNELEAAQNKTDAAEMAAIKASLGL